MPRWLPYVAATLLVVWLVFRKRRAVRPPAPALKLAGGPPDEAEEGLAGRPLIDSFTAALRARGYQAGDAAADDWGYLAEAIVDGCRFTLKLGAHGQNGVGRQWLLVLEGATDAPALRRVIEEAAESISGLRLLGWDD